MRQTHYKAVLALIAVSIIWGTTYLAIRIGVQSLQPVRRKKPVQSL